MTKNTENLIPENGIDLLVSYQFEKTPGYHAEKDNPGTWVEETVYTELESVELVLGGTGIEQIHLMDEKQKQYVIGMLTYEVE